MVLHSPDWTNIGFSFILLTVNLFCHPTLIEQRLYSVVYSVEVLSLFYILFISRFVMLSCVFATFPCGLLGQVLYLIVSVPNICLLPYFK